MIFFLDYARIIHGLSLDYLLYQDFPWNIPGIIPGLFFDYPWIVSQLSCIIPKLSLDYHKIYSGLSMNYSWFIPRVSLDYPWTYKGLFLDNPWISPDFYFD